MVLFSVGPGLKESPGIVKLSRWLLEEEDVSVCSPSPDYFMLIYIPCFQEAPPFSRISLAQSLNGDLEMWSTPPPTLYIKNTFEFHV